jgi:hypothetical protein
MDKSQFWQLIEKSKNKRGDCDAQAAKLKKLLVKLDAEDIIGFDQIFTELRIESYRWDLWAVAYIVNGGCSTTASNIFVAGSLHRDKNISEPPWNLQNAQRMPLPLVTRRNVKT